MYKHTRLVVRVSGEIFGFFSGNGGATLDKSDQDNSSNFDSVEKRGNVKKNLTPLIGLAGEDGRLDCSTISDSLIGLVLLSGSLPLKKSDTSLTI